MKFSIQLIFVVLLAYFSVPVIANDLKHSGATELWDNPFIAFGYNPKTKITTGYLAALRTAPGRTDACKLIFSSDLNKKNEFVVKYLDEKKSHKTPGQVRHTASLVVENNITYLRFLKKDVGGDCDWILPFVVESELSEDSNKIMVEVEAQRGGEWISVYTIAVEKAKFHSQPDSSSEGNAFLVKGDVIYVYDEKPEWYFVKYDEGKKKTEGWIKKSDTLQL